MSTQGFLSALEQPPRKNPQNQLQREDLIEDQAEDQFLKYPQSVVAQIPAEALVALAATD